LTLEASFRPRGPYSLALTARRAGDATRTFRDGLLDAAVPTSTGVERARAWQRPDGTVFIRAESDEGLERMRFTLAVDDDHTPFLRRCEHDLLLRKTARHFRGLRQIRVTTVAHALLRAICGQLITAKQARMIEGRVIRSVGGGTPPTAAALGAAAPARLRALGLHSRRAASLVRLCRELDLERLRELPTSAVEARLLRERGLGPWSVGVVCLEGLGRHECGLVGDLGLVKLVVALRGGGGWVEGAETAELLEQYEEWAGLASVYLLLGFSRGLVPLPARRAA
jgi:3-methyladenine DNA glycosylase/8-oxoguanine DNA glycosylase